MKRTKGEKIYEIFNIIFMLFICVIMIFPYLNQIAISLNEGWDTSFGGITIFPRKFTLINYKTLLLNDGILDAFILTVENVVIHTLLSLLVTVGAAYALNKRDLPFRNQLLMFFMIPMYITPGTIPIFMLFRTLHLLDNRLLYFVMGLFSFYNSVVIRSFMRSLPESLEESAKLDGANEVIILFRIILPLCMPVIATVALWGMVGSWNNYTTSMLYMTKRSLYTLQFVVNQIIKQSDVVAQLQAETALTGGGESLAESVTSQSVQSAAIIFSTLPIIMVYPFLQKYFVKGVTVGAVKD
ncbi:MAG: carbohydrate ABC transporter permease [Clostridia bacterium]|nr:carbohydrate ABC transporter permease [Clostridia bacterium]